MISIPRPRPVRYVQTDAWLSWPGRRWAPGLENPEGPESGGSRPPALVTTEVVGAGALDSSLARSDSTTPSGRLIAGDALEVAGAIGRTELKGRVDLVYVDPPFASEAAYVHEARLDGPADGRVVRARAYDDRWGGGLGSYLEMMAPRLEALAGLLTAEGTIWVHVDWRASYLVRLLLDEILGRDAFKNEIVWRRAPNLGRQAASHQFGRTLDTLIVYGGPEARLAPPTRLEPVSANAVRRDDEGRLFTSAPRGDYTDESIQRLEREGRIHRTPSGKVYVKYFLVQSADGTWCRERRVDALWTDVPALRHARDGERTGFPTQKPRALLDRVIACASPPGGLVVDLFAGSGTTGESAHALGRRFVLGDASPLAIATARARLLRAGVPLVMQSCPGETRGRDEASPIRAALERRGQAVRVELLEPREPLAWAIDPSHDPSAPFRVAWHSERGPGSRAVRPALLQAELDLAPGPVAVRVYSDDGGVETRIVEGA